MRLETKIEKKINSSPRGPRITEKAVWSFNLLFTLLMFGKWGKIQEKKTGRLKEKGIEKK